MAFAKNIVTNISKIVGETLSGKYNQKRMDHAKKSTRDVHKTAFLKKAETTGDLTGNKIADKLPKVSITLPQNTLNIVLSETEGKGFDVKIPKKDIHTQNKDKNY